jgi:hypothetical protein
METSESHAGDALLGTDTTEAMQVDQHLIDPLLPGIPAEGMQVDPDKTDPLLPGMTQDSMPADYTSTTEPQDPLMNHTPRPEGVARSRNKGLSDSEGGVFKIGDGRDGGVDS